MWASAFLAYLINTSFAFYLYVGGVGFLVGKCKEDMPYCFWLCALLRERDEDEGNALGHGELVAGSC